MNELRQRAAKFMWVEDMRKYKDKKKAFIVALDSTASTSSNSNLVC